MPDVLQRDYIACMHPPSALLNLLMWEHVHSLDLHAGTRLVDPDVVSDPVCMTSAYLSVAATCCCALTMW